MNKAGVNIDGKQVLAGSVNYYKVMADYSQYKGIEADKDRIGKGFYIVDDYPEEAVTINQDGVQVTDSKGQVVKGLKMALYEEFQIRHHQVQEALKSSNFTPKGAIQVFEAENQRSSTRPTCKLEKFYLNEIHSCFDRQVMCSVRRTPSNAHGTFSFV